MTPEQAIEFCRMLKEELFDKTVPAEYCSNAGDPGEACECCPVLDRNGNPVNKGEE